MLPAAIAERAARQPPSPPSPPPALRDAPVLDGATVDAVADYGALLEAERVKGWPCASSSYHVERLLGQGTFAVCFLALKASMWQPSSYVALKVHRWQAQTAAAAAVATDLMLSRRLP